jgi:hypothetical protein
MSRWHKPSCQVPDIKLYKGDEGTVPRCLRCDAIPNLSDLITQKAKNVKPWSVPQDEAEGQMNLYWPPSVPYRLPSSPSAATDSPAVEFASENAQGDQRKDVSPEISTPERKGSTYPSVYERRLREDEFRIICLSPASGQDRELPIHVELEIHDQNKSPEYEATSYMWAGEDGDKEMCRPVYIGRYWDILLQTKNCWNMLQYLRPWRGERLIWVDAICINQDDLVERGVQVSQMGRIYRKCLRVILYLGSDMVPHTRYRKRCGIHERDIWKPQNEQDPLQMIFRRKYFSRVWIIQELILSPSIVMPFQEFDLFMDSRSTELLQSPIGHWDWVKSGIPWMQYLSTGYISGDALDHVLRITWKSDASDQRDKIFGVLGLISNESIADNILPDYSISYKHSLVGSCAYILICQKRYCILQKPFSYVAATSTFLPSWITDWRTEEIPPLKKLGAGPYLTDIKSQVGLTDNNRLDGTKSIYLAPSWRFRDAIDRPTPSIDHGSVALRQAAVETSTGALSLDLIRLLDYTTNLKIEDSTLIIESGSFIVRIFVYLATTSLSEKHDGTAEKKSIFIFEGGDTHERYILLMLELSKKDSYRLLACYRCRGIWLEFRDEKAAMEFNPIHERRVDVDQMAEFIPTDRIASKIPTLVLPQTLYHAKAEILCEIMLALSDNHIRFMYDHDDEMPDEEMRRLWNSEFDVQEAMDNWRTRLCDPVIYPLILPAENAITIGDALTLVQELLNEENGRQTDGFAKAFVALIKRRFGYVREDFAAGCLYTSVPSACYTERQRIGLNRSGRRLDFRQFTSFKLKMMEPEKIYPKYWDQLLENLKYRDQLPGNLKYRDELLGNPRYWSQLQGVDIELKFEIHKLAAALMETKYYCCLRRLTPATQITGENELAILSRGLRIEDMQITYRNWPTRAIEELGLDGMYQRVSIC